MQLKNENSLDKYIQEVSNRSITEQKSNNIKKIKDIIKESTIKEVLDVVPPPKVIKGENGLSLNWLGGFQKAPINKKLNDVYRNTYEGIVYICDGYRWVEFIRDGENGRSAYGSGTGVAEVNRLIDAKISSVNSVSGSTNNTLTSVIDYSNHPYTLTSATDILIAKTDGGNIIVNMPDGSTSPHKIKNWGFLANSVTLSSSNDIEDNTILNGECNEYIYDDELGWIILTRG